MYVIEKQLSSQDKKLEPKKCPQILQHFMHAQYLQQQNSKGQLDIQELISIRDQTLLIELQVIVLHICIVSKMLQKYCPIGVFVLPSYEKKHIWHGVYFVKQGLFGGGVFKFVIEFPSEYPNKRPQVRFLTPLFHPLVSRDNYDLNLDFEFKEWTPGKHWFINVLAYVKKLFHLESMFDLSGSEIEASNTEALELYQQDFSKFATKCKQCVAKSQDLKFNNYPSSLLKFSQYLPAHDTIIEKIKETASESGDQLENKEAIKNWFFQNFKQVVQNGE